MMLIVDSFLRYVIFCKYGMLRYISKYVCIGLLDDFYIYINGYS